MNSYPFIRNELECTIPLGNISNYHGIRLRFAAMFGIGTRTINYSRTHYKFKAQPIEITFVVRYRFVWCLKRLELPGIHKWSPNIIYRCRLSPSRKFTVFGCKTQTLSISKIPLTDKGHPSLCRNSWKEQHKSITKTTSRRLPSDILLPNSSGKAILARGESTRFKIRRWSPPRASAGVVR